MKIGLLSSALGLFLAQLLRCTSRYDGASLWLCVFVCRLRYRSDISRYLKEGLKSCSSCGNEESSRAQMLLCRRYQNDKTSHFRRFCLVGHCLRPSLHGFRVERASPAAHSSLSHLRYQVCSRIKFRATCLAFEVAPVEYLVRHMDWDIRAAVGIRTTLLLWISLFFSPAPLVRSTMLHSQTLVILRSVVIYRKKVSSKMQRDPRPFKIRTCFSPVERFMQVTFHPSNHNIATLHYCDAPHPTLWRLAQHP